MYIVYMGYKRVNIGLRYDVYTKLKDKGKFGESFSQLVSRVLDEVNKGEPQSGNNMEGHIK
jgi:predicted CopG family antitoxin